VRQKVAEEYCWAITKAGEPSCCDSEGFKLDCSVYTHIVDRMYTQFRLGQNAAYAGRFGR
jgi:hypothetical protein